MLFSGRKKQPNKFCFNLKLQRFLLLWTSHVLFQNQPLHTFPLLQGRRLRLPRWSQLNRSTRGQSSDCEVDSRPFVGNNNCSIQLQHYEVCWDWHLHRWGRGRWEFIPLLFFSEGFLPAFDIPRTARYHGPSVELFQSPHLSGVKEREGKLSTPNVSLPPMFAVESILVSLAIILVIII